MAGFDLDYIVDDDGLDLFNDTGEQQTPSNAEEEKGNKGGQGNENNNNTAEGEKVDIDSLFGDPESVGSGENNNGEGEDTSSSEGETSPNFFSSNAKAFAEEGIFPDLDDEEINNIKDAASFRAAVEKQMRAGLDEMQRRVTEALEAGVEPNIVRQYEGVLNQLNNIDEEELSKEENEDLRKRIIFQDYINRGFNKVRAEREVNKALENGTDIDDAKEALKSNKEFFQGKYQEILDNAKKESEEEKKKDEEKANKIKEELLNPKTKFFDELELDKATRQKVLDNISKPIYKNPKTGDVLTAVQKYEFEHGQDFLVKVGLLYTLTDGFKSLDGLVKGKVNKEVKKGFNALEGKINNTARDNEGNLRYASGVDDSEDYLGKGIRLDI